MAFGIFAGATNIAYKYMLVAKFVCTAGYIASVQHKHFTFSKAENIFHSNGYFRLESLK